MAVKEGPGSENGAFLENQVASLTFSCNRCNHIRMIKAKKVTPSSVIVKDIKVGTEDEGKMIYEVEMRPFPANTKELGEYMLRAHIQFVHGATEASISDLRN